MLLNNLGRLAQFLGISVINGNMYNVVYIIYSFFFIFIHITHFSHKIFSDKSSKC